MSMSKPNSSPGKSATGAGADRLAAHKGSQQPPGEHWAEPELGINHAGSARERLWHRLREDFRLAMVSLFGLIALLAITPFAIFRFVKGELAVALVDLGIVLAIAIGIIVAWRFDKSETAGNLMAAIVTVSAAAAVIGLDLSPLWVMAVLVASFLVASSWSAAIFSAALIGLVMGHEPAFSGPIERWTFLAVSVQVALYSLIFSLRSNQRQASLAFLADNDPLTGLGNRRALRHDLTSLVSQNGQQNLNLALAMLDLDHFKQVNDEYGHAAGDRVLVDLAGILAESTRESDHGYRFGGEEFVLILQGVDAAGLESALNKLLERIRDRLKSPGGPVTVSIGATRVLSDDTVHSCFSRADQAMYKAKAGGRDRLVML